VRPILLERWRHGWRLILQIIRLADGNQTQYLRSCQAHLR
jgi:hypothetical protein